MHRFLRLAYDLGNAHQFDPSLDFKHCAVIVRGGKILSVGYNRRGWNGLSEHYRANDYSCTVHAEADAIISKRRKIRFEGAKIYVVRLKAFGLVGNSKPCVMCSQMLKSYGFKRVHYTTDEFPFIDSYRL